MIDHINIPVRQMGISRPFYRDVLASLGYGVVAEDGPAVGFGTTHWMFGIVETEEAFTPLHLAFVATDRQQVDVFYESALAKGARCNGSPGFREIYGPGYYAAFVIDPDGHNIEAVFRG